jgi:hypothetical protein
LGGLVGQISNSNTIDNSYATGNVTGTGVTSASVGGLVGYFLDNASNAATITNSYATGNVSGSSEVGGLVGDQSVVVSTITNSFAAGAVSSTGGSNLGAFAGRQNGTVTGGGYNTEVNVEMPAAGVQGGSSATTGLAPLETVAFKKIGTYAAWNLASNDDLGMYDGFGTPYIKTIPNYILITPDVVTPATYTGSAVTPPALTWTADANYNAAVNPINGDLAIATDPELINAGDYAILSGTVDLKNPYYQTSFASNAVFTINKATQTITFDPATTVNLSAETYLLTATASSGLEVLYAVDDPTLAEVAYNEGVASLILKAAGTVHVTATVEADDNYEDATPVTKAIVITPITNIESASVAHLQVAVNEGGLTVSGLTLGGQLTVYNAQGALVARQTIVNAELSIALPVHGVYVVVAGNDKVKVVY